MMVRSYKILLLLFAFDMLSGCTTVFHPKQRIEIICPSNISVQDMQGRNLIKGSDDFGRYVYPFERSLDSVHIIYGAKTADVALIRIFEGFGLLNILNVGV